MTGTVYEWYGYLSTDPSSIAAHAANTKQCPFVRRECTKASGLCSVSPMGSDTPVPVCPKRLYFNQFEMLRDIASTSFSGLALNRDVDGLPTLVPGGEARDVARASGLAQVGVFGAEGWGGEIRLPPLAGDGASYKVDFTLVLIGPDARLISFTPVEVQSIDTTGNTRAAISALSQDRSIVADTVGLNWENVSKRILPQLIFKGLMLQGEALCRDGLFFVTPEPVFKRIMSRLGNSALTRLRRIPRQPGSITFLRYDYSNPGSLGAASPASLRQSDPFTISTSDLSLAFITPENLPPSGSYAARIEAKL